MERPDESRPDTIALVTALAGLGLLLLLSFLVRKPCGDEEIAHYLIARYAPGRPDLFLSLVGRPLVTLLLCLPAQLGLTAARILMALVTSATIYATARLLARSGTGLPAPWALPLLLVQPFFLAHATVAMTEPIAAALVAFGLLAGVEKRSGRLVVFAILAGLARTELVVLWPLVTWRLLSLGAGRRALWLLLPFPLWGVLGALSSGDPLWLLHQAQWGYYPERDAGHYLRSFGWVTGPGLLLPILVGLLSVRRVARRDPDDGARLVLAAALVVLLLLAVYTALAWWLPVTYGNLRYLAVAAAPLALLAAAGVGRLGGLRERGTWIRAGVALALLALVGGHALHNDFVILKRWTIWPALAALTLLATAWLVPARPRWYAGVACGAGAAALVAFYPRTLYWAEIPELAAVAAAAAARPASSTAGSSALRAAHPALAYHLGRNPYDPTDWPPLPETFRSSAAPGTLLFWDSHYLAPRGGSWSAESFAADPEWDFRSGVIAEDSTFAGAWFERRSTPRASTDAPPGAATWLEGVRAVLGGAPRTRRLIAADPGDPSAWRSLALQLLAVDDIPAARAAAARLERLAPGAPENALVTASLQLKIGNPDRALTALQGALAVRPEDGELQLVAGRLLALMNRPHEARPHLDAAARRLAKRWDVQMIVGSFLMDQKEWPAAEVCFRRAVRMNPRHPDPSLRLVEAVVRQGRVDDARVLLEDLIRRQPTFPEGYRYLGDLLNGRGRRDEALRVWREGFDRTGDAVLKERIGGK